MAHELTLELPDEIFEPFAKAAAQAGQSVEKWAEAQLRFCAATADRRAADSTRLLQHAGAVDLGKPAGADNERIDANLAREYGFSHGSSAPGRMTA